MTLWTSSFSQLLFRGLCVQWKHPRCPKMSQASTYISATKSYICLCSLERCMAHCVAFSSRLCWLSLFHLFWLKWDCWAPAWHWTIGVFSIPLIIIRQSKVDQHAASCGTQQMIPLNHVCPITRQHWTQRFDIADDHGVILKCCWSPQLILCQQDWVYA